jgi:hypothetical protein
MYFSLHLIIYLENPAGTLICGRREYRAKITTEALALTLRNCAYLHTKMLDLSSVAHVDLFPEKMG